MNGIYDLTARQNSSFEPSETIQKIVLNSEVSNSHSSGTITIGSFTPLLGGTVRLDSSLRANNGLANGTRPIVISDGSRTVAELKPITDGTYSKVFADIPVTKDTLYTATLGNVYTGNYGTACNYLAVCGTVALPSEEVIK